MRPKRKNYSASSPRKTRKQNKQPINIDDDVKLKMSPCVVLTALEKDHAMSLYYRKCLNKWKRKQIVREISKQSTDNTSDSHDDTWNDENIHAKSRSGRKKRARKRLKTCSDSKWSDYSVHSSNLSSSSSTETLDDTGSEKNSFKLKLRSAKNVPSKMFRKKQQVLLKSDSSDSESAPERGVNNSTPIYTTEGVTARKICEDDTWYCGEKSHSSKKERNMKFSKLNTCLDSINHGDQGECSYKEKSEITLSNLEAKLDNSIIHKYDNTDISHSLLGHDNTSSKTSHFDNCPVHIEREETSNQIKTYKRKTPDPGTMTSSLSKKLKPNNASKTAEFEKNKLLEGNMMDENQNFYVFSSTDHYNPKTMIEETESSNRINLLYDANSNIIHNYESSIDEQKSANLHYAPNTAIVLSSKNIDIPNTTVQPSMPSLFDPPISFDQNIESNTDTTTQTLNRNVEQVQVLENLSQHVNLFEEPEVQSSLYNETSAEHIQKPKIIGCTVLPENSIQLRKSDATFQHHDEVEYDLAEFFTFQNRKNEANPDESNEGHLLSEFPFLYSRLTSEIEVSRDVSKRETSPDKPTFESKDIDSKEVTSEVIPKTEFECKKEQEHDNSHVTAITVDNLRAFTEEQDNDKSRTRHLEHDSKNDSDTDMKYFNENEQSPGNLKESNQAKRNRLSGAKTKVDKLNINRWLQETSNSPEVSNVTGFCKTPTDAKEFDKVKEHGISATSSSSDSESSSSSDDSVDSASADTEIVNIRGPKSEPEEFGQKATKENSDKASARVRSITSEISKYESESDEDILSLSPNSSLFSMENEDIEENPKRTTPPKNIPSHSMTELYTIDSNEYYKSNKREFDKDYQLVNEVQKSVKDRLGERKQLAKLNSISFNAIESQDPSIGTTVPPNPTLDSQLFLSDKRRLFQGYCYMKLKYVCRLGNSCRYIHDVTPLTNQLLSLRGLNQFHEYIDHCLSHFQSYAKEIYEQLISQMNISFISDLFRKFFNARLINDSIMSSTFKELMNNGVPLNEIVNNLGAFDCVLIHLEQHIPRGEYFNFMQRYGLLHKATSYMIRKILEECVTVKRDTTHARNVYSHFMQHVPNWTQYVKRELVSSFNELCYGKHPQSSNAWAAKVQNTEIRASKTIASSAQVAKENVEVVETIASPDANSAEATHYISKYASTQVKESVQSLSRNKVETEAKRDTKETTFAPRITDVPEPRSVYGDRFWTLNLDVLRIKTALEHNDYDYVLRVLDEQKTMNTNELFRNWCYSMLTSEIKRSERHWRIVVELSVQNGMITVLHEPLFELGKLILIDLVDNGTWVLAYKFLQSLQVFHSKFDAAFVLLSTEIYLANRYPFKALDLLKQTKLIYTDSTKWTVSNNEEDKNLRANIMRPLLDAFCDVSPQHAFTVFEFLLNDQSCNYEPVDLTQYVDRVTAVLLSSKQVESIINMGTLIIKYELVPRTVILRALIATLVHSDMNLAKQLYQYSVGLGVYCPLEVSTMHIVINTNWTEEEIYLIFTEFFWHLFLHLGHAINTVKPNKLPVYLIFQDVPTEPELYYDNMSNDIMYNRNKTKMCQALVSEILEKRFDPPMFTVKRQYSTIRKLVGRSVLHYLTETYCA